MGTPGRTVEEDAARVGELLEGVQISEEVVKELLEISYQRGVEDTLRCGRRGRTNYDFRD